MGNYQSNRFVARFLEVMPKRIAICCRYRVYLEVIKEIRSAFVLVVQNAPLPSVKSWLAERLGIFYHKIALKSPSCPTLAKVKELDFAYLRCTRTAYCAGTNQHTHTASCSYS